MSQENDGQTRSEQPTPKKRTDSRKKGQVARSRELNTTVMMLAASVGLLLLGRQIGNEMQVLLASNMVLDQRVLSSNAQLLLHLSNVTHSAIAIFSPFFIIMLIAAFVGPVVLGGWSFSISSWKPKLNRMSPISGLKRMFGLQGIVEMLKSLGKFLTIAVVALVGLSFFQEQIFTLNAMSAIEGMHSGFKIIGVVFFLLSISLLLVAFIDVPYQLVSHTNRLKMSVQEVREENKQTNGNPELKARIRSKQREISDRRMLADVADADVVITNPSHYAVALKYDEHSANAPVVVATGVDFMAMRIREIAQGNDVTIFSAPPLARALYHHSEVGEELPVGLYQAVAQVLAYVYQIKNSSVSQSHRIIKPRVFDIPAEYEVPVDTQE